MTVGDKIKFLRKSKGLTQTELGAIVGVKKNAVSKWECGRVEDIPTSTIKALAALFEVKPSYLIDDNAKQPTESDGLSETDRQLIALLKLLSMEQKQLLLAQLRVLTDGQ